MKFTELPLKGSYLIQLDTFNDNRGWFSRTFCKEEFDMFELETVWLQTNHSFTQKKGTIRGMHFQRPPYSEVKLVRCIAGAVLDVIIDLRENSPTFLQWHAEELSAENKKMMYVPIGFAHGFQSLTDNVEILYQHSQIYKPGSEEGLLYNDPAIGIKWPIEISVISERDKSFQPVSLNFKPV